MFYLNYQVITVVFCRGKCIAWSENCSLNRVFHKLSQLCTFVKNPNSSDIDIDGDTCILKTQCFLPRANEVWGKVIFSEACVKNSVHRGGLVPGVGGLVLGGGGSGPGGCLLPRGGLVLGGGGSGPGGTCSWGVWSRGGVPGGDSPGTATAAGGTHPTGMHSCLWRNYEEDMIMC